MRAYTYRGYWEDIGTIKNFYETNLDLGSPRPQFNLYDQHNPLYTHRRDLPPTKINSSTMNNSIASEGSIITNAVINRCLIGIRTIIRSGARLDGVYTMGADYYETQEQFEENRSQGIPGYGVDEGTSISGAIIDRNARIGRNCRIGVDQCHRMDGDYEGYSVRDGIIIILKGAVIPDNTQI